MTNILYVISTIGGTDVCISRSESDTDRMQTQPKTRWLSHASQAKQGHRKNTGSDGKPSDVPAVAKATV